MCTYDEVGLSQHCETSNKWRMSVIDSLCSKWLFLLNGRTRRFIKDYNADYDISLSTRYISLQIRLRDKQSEMDPHQCKFLE